MNIRTLDRPILVITINKHLIIYILRYYYVFLWLYIQFLSFVTILYSNIEAKKKFKKRINLKNKNFQLQLFSSEAIPIILFIFLCFYSRELFLLLQKIMKLLFMFGIDDDGQCGNRNILVSISYRFPRRNNFHC